MAAVMIAEKRTPGARTVDEGQIAEIDRLPLAVVVRELAGVISLSATAALAGATHTDTVRGWISGAEIGDAFLETRLRETLKAMHYLVMSDGPGVAKTWFFSLNPSLNAVPAHVMRDARTVETLQRAVRAARTTATA